MNGVSLPGSTVLSVLLRRIPWYGRFDMTTIATLGPANTFSELAAIKYGEEIGGEFSVEMPADAKDDGRC